MYRYNNFRRYPGDRFFGGGFVGPFILGGITGGLIANNRPNNYNPVFYYPYPIYYPNQYY